MQDNQYFNETEYIEGFNLGYRMTRDYPELAEFLDYARGQNDKLEGLKDGRSQYKEELLEKSLEQEKEKEKKPHLPWLRADRLNQDNKSKDIDKDIEPDR